VKYGGTAAAILRKALVLVVSVVLLVTLVVPVWRAAAICGNRISARKRAQK
jgi:hypothetical protein